MAGRTGITYHQLQTFLAVARSGNLTKVARELNATQPTVSLQLRSLRKSLGTPLFERPGGRFRLTPAGEKLRRYAEEALEGLRTLQEDIAVLKGGLTGSLAVGVTFFVVSRVLPEPPRFRARFPGVDVQVHVDLPEPLFNHLLTNTLDVACYLKVRTPPGLTVEPLGQEEFAIIASPRHRLAVRRRRIALHVTCVPVENTGMRAVLRKLLGGCCPGKLPLAAPSSSATLKRVHLDETGRAETLARAANPMEAVYYRHDGRGAHKWHHYLELYDRHLGRFRGQAVRVLELGIHQGGSLQIWKGYFGERAIIHGIDIDPKCARVAEDRIVPHIGNQADVGFLKQVAKEMGGVDIVIDDGGHLSPLQIASFEALYPMVDSNGVYICEDTRASYWSRYGGGYRKPGTFIEYAKALVDPLHVWYIEDDTIARDETFARTTLGIFFYDSLVVFEKRPRDVPVQYVVGHAGL